MVRRLASITLLLLALVACGTEDTPVSTAPTVTPFPGGAVETETPTEETPVTSPTTTAANADLAAAQEALDNRDYALAIEFLTRAYTDNKDNAEIATQLGEAHHLHGEALLEQAGIDTERIREAFDTFSRGLQVVPEKSDMYTTLDNDQKIAAGLLDIIAEFEAYDAIDKDDTEKLKPHAETIFAKLEELKELGAEYPGVAELRFKGLMAIANIRRTEALALKTLDERKPLLDEAKGYCTEAEQLAGDDSSKTELVDECLERIETASVIATPVPTKEPTKVQPTLPPATKAPPPPPPASKRFAGWAATGYGQGEISNQFSSCLSGRVVDKSGVGIDGAAGNSNNGQGQSYDWVTGGGGYFNIGCGLGHSNWASVLYFVPGGNDNQPVAYTWLDGTPNQKAFIMFQQQ